MELDVQHEFGQMEVNNKKKPLQEIQPGNRDLGQCSEEDQARLAVLMKKARSAVEEGHPRAALEILQEAAKIQRTEKIAKRIAKLEAYLAQNGSEDEEEDDDNMVHMGKGFYVYRDLYDKLYDYQREALLWFWRLHRKQKGGILGDDMGLGKTVQVVAFLSGLFDMEQVSSVLIVVPVALVINWQREFKQWAPGIPIHVFHGASKKERERLLERVQRRGGVLMVSYGLVVTCWEQINHYHGSEFAWDYVMLDEGHKIKNPTKTTKAVNAINATHRFILTGTPIQNNLKELWSLFNFVTHGTLLGTLQTFKSEYDNPITRAREKDATASEKLLGNEMAESLRLLIAPYFLRRTKADVLENKKGEKEGGTGRGNQESEREELDSDGRKASGSVSPENSIPSLTRKNDLIVWLSLSETQIQIYKDFISLDRVKELLMTKRSPLAELTILKKVCDHPRLLSNKACRQLGLQMSQDGYDENDEPSMDSECAANSIASISDEALLMESGKLQFLVLLLTNLRAEGHRCLVFSQSRKMLDIVEKVLQARNFKLMRMDGTITKLSERENRISRFQDNSSYSVFLLTTQVGGVGLTLTGADRVVIIDPSWNPATDNQAVDRVYRIGQTRSVVIYRLITCGTVEEKIYRRQIFKESLTKQTTGSSKNPYRYFTGQQLRELFVLDDPRVSETQQQLEEMHTAQRKTDIDLDAHIAFLYSTDIFGISDHDLMFTQEAQAEQHEDFEEEGNQYIQQRVQRAQDLVAAESDLTRKLNDHIQRDTEGAGSSQRKKRYSMNVNRERLQSEWAEKTGEGVINPPLQHVPKHYRPEDRPPPRQPHIEATVQELDRTMEELTLNDDDESNASPNEEEEDLAQRSLDLQEDLSDGVVGDDDEDDVVVVEDDSFTGDGGDKRPPSVFAVEDGDSRPGSKLEDRAFIEGESEMINSTGHREYGDVDDGEGGQEDVAERENEEMGIIDDEVLSGGAGNGSDIINSNLSGSASKERSEESNESFELVTGMSPAKNTLGSPHCEGSGDGPSDYNVFDSAVSHISMTTGSASQLGGSGGLHSRPVMPSDSDSYGMMETTLGQPSDLPYFQASRRLSMENSGSLSASRPGSVNETVDARINTVQWDEGTSAFEESARFQSPTSRSEQQGGKCLDAKMEDRELEGRGEDEEDNDMVDGDDDDDGSFGEVVEVSMASFSCQAQGEMSQDDDKIEEEEDCNDVSYPGSLDAEELDTDRSPGDRRDGTSMGEAVEVSMASFSCQAHEEMSEDVDEEEDQGEKTSMSSAEQKNGTPIRWTKKEEDKGEKHLSIQDDDQDMEGESYVDVSMASFCGQVDDRDSQLDMPSPSNDSQTETNDQKNHTDIVPDQNLGTGIDLDATSRFLGLTSRDSPFVDTSSPVVAKKRHVRRIVSDDEEEESEGIDKSHDGFTDDGANGRRVMGSVRRREKPIGLVKERGSIFVGDSDEAEEEKDITEASPDSLTSGSRELSNDYGGSMDNFIVEDSDEEESILERAEDRDTVIDESLELSADSGGHLGHKDEDKMMGSEAGSERDDRTGAQHNAANLGSSRVKTASLSDETEERREETLESDASETDSIHIEGSREEDADYSEEEEEGDELEGDEGDEESEGEEEEEENDSDEDDEDRELREKYKILVKDGMSKMKEGDSRGALRAFLQALYIDGSSQHLQLIAVKLKKKLDNE